MARNGITETEIVEAIHALQAEGTGITVQAIRSKLGTGSYTTIQVALERWRNSQTGVGIAMPEIPERIAGLSRLLWAETWKEALKHWETEKAAFGEERQKFEALRADMTAEMTRLESDLAKATTDRDALEHRLKASDETIQELKLMLTTEKGQRQSLESEIARLTQECALSREESKVWIERACRAEGRLEERNNEKNSQTL